MPVDGDLLGQGADRTGGIGVVDVIHQVSVVAFGVDVDRHGVLGLGDQTETVWMRVDPLIRLQSIVQVVSGSSDNRFASINAAIEWRWSSLCLHGTVSHRPYGTLYVTRDVSQDATMFPFFLVVLIISILFFYWFSLVGRLAPATLSPRMG